MKIVRRIKQVAYVFGILGIISTTLANEGQFSLIFQPNMESDYPRDNFAPKGIGETSLNIPLDSPLEKITLPKTVATFNGKTLYASNVDGVGLSLNINGQDLNLQGEIPIPFPAKDQLEVSAQLVLYKALDAKEYLVEKSPLLTLWLSDKQQLPLNLAPVQLAVRKRSCTLLNQNEKVSLKTALQNDLLHKGSEVFGGRFNLNLKCDPKVEANVTFFDQSDFHNRTDVLSLDPIKSTAKGVGLRLYRQTRQAVQFGTPWLFSTNELRPSQEFEVFYLNRDGKISAGTVNATATVTFTYR